MGYFCPLCGKSINYAETIEGLCIHCYYEKHPIIEDTIFKDFTLSVCKFCGAIQDKKHRWHYYDTPLEDVFIKEIASYLKSKIKSKNIDFKIYDGSIKVLSATSGVFSFKIDIIVSLPQHMNKRYHIINTFEVPVYFSICDKCKKIKSGYFEAIVRFKKANDFIDKKTHEEIKQTLKNLMLAYTDNPKGFILKLTEKKKFLEAKVGSGTVAKAIGSYFRKHYNAHVIVTSKLKGMVSGKNVYQLAVSIELPKYHKGDLLKVGNEDICVVSKVTSKGIICDGLFSHKKYVFTRQDLEQSKISKISSDEIDEYQVISEKQNTYQIMSLSTYQIYEISKSEIPVSLRKDDVLKGILFRNKVIFLAKK